jgi:hypothetical protein
MCDTVYCPRCGLPLARYELGKAVIDGDHAHVDCAIDEMDECGIDDF